VGDAVQIALMPNPDSALMLFLAAHIEAQTPPPTSPTPLPPDCSCQLTNKPVPLWERWVFRRHRRAILER
jgi:hypothetical protein